MYLERVEIHDFRVYDRVVLEFSPGLNVLLGPNAAGKSTVLEALGVLATGRSFRGATDAEMVRNGRKAYRVSGRLSGTLGSHIIEVIYTAPADTASAARRVISVDGRPLARPSDILGRLPLVSFSPDDLPLAKGAPAERRRFLDSLLGQTSAAYRESLIRYHRILSQRNALLGDLGARRLATSAAAELLAPWDEALAGAAAEVQTRRATAVAALEPLAARAFARIDGGHLAVSYRPDRFDPSGRLDELRRGLTLSGPHRDEVVLTVDAQEARRFASQGQQRSAVLALKLAALELLEREAGERPLLLLDDVMSELDPGRRAALLALLGRGQAFVTGTDRLGLERALSEGNPPAGGERWFSVVGGTVCAEDPPAPPAEVTDDPPAR